MTSALFRSFRTLVIAAAIASFIVAPSWLFAQEDPNVPEAATPEPATPEPVAPEPAAPEPVAPEPVGIAPRTGRLEAPRTLPVLPTPHKPIKADYWEPIVRAVNDGISISAPRRIRLQVNERRTIPVRITNSNGGAVTMRITPWAPTGCVVAGATETVPRGSNRYDLPIHVLLAGDHHFYLTFTYGENALFLPIDVKVDVAPPVFGVYEVGAAGAVTLLGSLPAQVVGVRISRAAIEKTPRVFDWAELDAEVADLRVGSPARYVATVEDVTTLDETFLATVAERYAGVFGSWVLPPPTGQEEHVTFWAGPTLAAAAAIRKADADALVIVSLGAPTGAVDLLARAFWGLRLGDSVDAVAVEVSHPLNSTGDAGAAAPGFDPAAWAAFDQAMNLEGVIRAVRDAGVGSVWVTGVDLTPARWAALGALRAQAIWAAQGVKVILASRFFGDGTGAGYLAAPSGEKTLTFDAWQAMVEAISGAVPDRTWVRVAAGEGTDAFALGGPVTARAFRQGESRVLCIWSNAADSREVQVSVPAGMRPREVTSLTPSSLQLRSWAPAEANSVPGQVGITLQPLEFRMVVFR